MSSEPRTPENEPVDPSQDGLTGNDNTGSEPLPAERIGSGDDDVADTQESATAPTEDTPDVIPADLAEEVLPAKKGKREKATGLAKGDPEPGVAKVDPIMVIDNVTRRFGGLTAVDVDHLEIPRNAITALIGPNGAGKTTLFNLLCGFDKPNSGTWSFDGTQLSGIPSFKVARMGQVRTFQLTKALSLLSVLENMKLGATKQKGEKIWASVIPALWRSQENEIEEKARRLLARFKLDAKEQDYAASLSGGQRKLLEMARALMSDPTLVMLDEPMAGVNPALAQTIIGHVRDLAADGLSVVFVEHDMDVVRTVSDWVVVMAEGRVIAEGKHASIVTNPEVIDAYLGRHHGTPLDPVEQERQLAEAQAEIEAELEAEEERAREQEGA